MKKRYSVSTILLVVMFLAGLSLLLYPVVSNYWNSVHQSRAINTYSNEVEQQEKEENNGDERSSCCPQMYGLEAQKIAMETKSRINVVMLGAVLKIMGVENPKTGEQICKDTLGKKYPASLLKVLRGTKLSSKASTSSDETL